MGKIIKNSTGQVLVSSSGAFEVTAAVDSNIVAGNIKKDVEILGVTGTYEGSGGGGGGTPLNFYTCRSNEPQPYVNGAKAPRPETNITFYCDYPSIDTAIPVAILVYDENKSVFILSNSVLVGIGDSFGDYIGTYSITLVALTDTLATFNLVTPSQSFSFDPTIFACAPIYAINHYE